MNKLNKKALPHLTKHYKKDTHWYIPHTAGNLKIILSPYCPAVTSFQKGYTNYLIAIKNKLGGYSETYKEITNQEEFSAWRTELDAIAETKNTPIFLNTSVISLCKWVLSDGTIIEGNTIDTEVTEGETLCICPNFAWYHIDILCDIVTCEDRDFPNCHGFHKRTRNYLTDLKQFNIDTSKFYNINQEKVSQGFQILNLVGTAEKPRLIRATTRDLTNLMGQVYDIARVAIQYCPFITGDLQQFSVQKYTAISHYTDIATGERTYHDYYKGSSNILFNEGSPDIWKFSIHHTMVSGYPHMDVAYDIVDWEFYANPNVTPKDYDSFLDELLNNWNGYHIKETANVAGYVTPNEDQNDWVAATPGEYQWKIGYCPSIGSKVLPAFGTLKISNRTENPTARTEKLEKLRSMGWIVTEIDDSLEEGIYAAVI